MFHRVKSHVYIYRNIFGHILPNYEIVNGSCFLTFFTRINLPVFRDVWKYLQYMSLFRLLSLISPWICQKIALKTWKSPWISKRQLGRHPVQIEIMLNRESHYDWLWQICSAFFWDRVETYFETLPLLVFLFFSVLPARTPRN